jgi:isoleucyl-tRNA synthetase
MGEDTTISDKTLKIITQEYMLPLWNMMTYVLTYAELHDWQPEELLLESNYAGDPSATLMDQWLLARLHETIDTTTKYLNEFQTQKALETIKSLIEDFSKWYIRRSRDRFVAGDTVAMATSYHAMVLIIKLLAPFAPFVTEVMNKHLVQAAFDYTEESIHLSQYPVANRKIIHENLELLAQMKTLRDLSSLGQKLRSTAGIKLRQPLAKSYSESPLSEEMLAILAEELNTKTAEYSDQLTATNTLLVEQQNSVTVALDIELNDELRAEGLLRELVRSIQNERKNNGFQFGQMATLGFYTKDGELLKFVETNKEEIMKQTFLSQISIEPDPIGEEVKINEFKAVINLLSSEPN